MSNPGRGFDRLARWYRALEFVAFGRDLERARFAFLGRLADRKSILILGEGDGRCAARLLSLAPAARITCVDSSLGMIERARARTTEAGGGDRVSFVCADARSFTPEPGRYDAVVTLFVLDCFLAAEVASIVACVSSVLDPSAPWVFADFTLPPQGMARARARVWLAVLYAFFGWETDLAVSKLPPSEEILERAGWLRVETRAFQWGLLRSSVYRRRY